MTGLAQGSLPHCAHPPSIQAVVSRMDPVPASSASSVACSKPFLRATLPTAATIIFCAPVNGAAVDDGRVLPQALPEGVSNWTHAEHDVQVLADLVGTVSRGDEGCRA